MTSNLKGNTYGLEGGSGMIDYIDEIVGGFAAGCIIAYVTIGILGGL